MDTVRPLMTPSCEYLLLTTNGKQYTALGYAMSLLVHQAIGKYVNPTRYRQIIESESCERLTPTEMEAISKDQKHSSYVAKRIYQKKLSRDVAAQGKSCMVKMVGQERDNHTKHLASALAEKSPVHGVTPEVPLDDQLSLSASETEEAFTQEINESNPPIAIDNEDDKIEDSDVISSPMFPPKEFHIAGIEGSSVETLLSSNNVVTTTSINNITSTNVVSCRPSVSSNKNINRQCSLTVTSDSCFTDKDIDVEVKREEADNEVAMGPRLKRFTLEEDAFLKEGIRKHGLGRWIQVLRDKELKFHPCRKRDSLRMRADTLGLTNKKKSSRKQKQLR